MQYCKFYSFARIYQKIIKKQIFRIIDKKIDNEKLMINIGAGQNYFRRHWKVMDFSTSHYTFHRGIIDISHDLTSNKPFPFKDNSVFCFYSSHTFNYLPEENCKFILKEIYRCLKPESGVRITTWDISKLEKGFLNNDEKLFERVKGVLSNTESIEQKFLGQFDTYSAKKLSPSEIRLQYNKLGSKEFKDYFSKNIPRQWHKQNASDSSWWDINKIEKFLKDAGFRRIYSSTPQGSKFPEMRGKGRWTGFDSTKPPEVVFYIEAIK